MIIRGLLAQAAMVISANKIVSPVQALRIGLIIVLPDEMHVLDHKRRTKTILVQLYWLASLALECAESEADDTLDSPEPGN